MGYTITSFNVLHVFEWYRFVKRAGWDPKLVNESYPWVEREIVHQPKLTLWQKALRDSLLEVGVRPFNGYTYDHVSGTKIGGTIFDRFGRRHTAAELLAYANPQKLRVLIYATVQKIVFDTSGTLRAFQVTEELTILVFRS